MNDEMQRLEFRFDRRMERTSSMLRWLAYTMFTGSILMAYLDQTNDQPPGLVVTSGEVNVPFRQQIAQFLADVIPYAALSALVLVASVLIQIALARLRVARAAVVDTRVATHRSPQALDTDDLWRRPFDLVDD